MKKALLSLFALILVLTSIVGLASCGKVEFKVDFVVDGEVYASVDTNGKETIKIPADPTKEGYIFDGWYWDKDSWKKPFTANSLLDAHLSENMSVYAKWTTSDSIFGTDAEFEGFTDNGNNTWSITVNNATEILSLGNKVEVNSKSTWTLFTDVNGNNPVPSKTATLNIGDNTYYVMVEAENGQSELYTLNIRRKPVYSVTFNTLGGENVDALTVEEGETISAPESYKKGYTLAGWDYDFTSPVTANVEIKAIWQANDYKIIYNANGGTVAHEETGVVYDVAYTLEIPTRQGYEFTGWYLGENPIVNGIWKGDSNITVAAKWSLITYDIEYNLDGGTLATVNPEAYNFTSENITLTNPEKTGYTFIGWIGTDVSEPTLALEIASGSIGNRSYVANWVANTYTVTFDTNGGNESYENATATYDANITLPTPTKTGYSFAGWYEDTTPYTSGTWEITKNVNLVAKWDAVSYAIVYTLSGGSVDGANPTTYTIESEFTLINPTKTGYTFLGWTYGNVTEPTLTVTIADSACELSFVANFKADLFKIHFDANGGTLEKNEIDINYDDDIVLPAPEYAGHTFTGWYDGKDYVTGGKYNLTTDMNLVAIWDLVVYDISYTLNGGTVEGTNPTKYTIESEFALINPTKVGYTFLGWTYEGVTEPKLNVTISENTGAIEFVANWTVNKYTLSFDILDSVEIEYGTEFTLPIPEKLGYTFDGWFIGDNEFISGTWLYTENKSVVAEWTAVEYYISYKLNGGAVDGKNPTTYTIESEFALINPTKIGYTFLGWTYEGVTEPKLNVTISESTGAIEFVANFEANKNTAYKVEYYFENASKNGYDIRSTETENLTGTTDTNATVIPKNFDHFKFNAGMSKVTGNIEGDGSLVLKVYCDRNTYTVTTSVENSKGGSVTSGATKAYGNEITVTATVKAGYTWLGWYSGNDVVSSDLSYTFVVDKDISLVAKWSANEDTFYTVEYYHQNIDNNDYSLIHSDILMGTTDTLANATINNYPHFTYYAAISNASGNIDGDGEAVLKIYYTRSSYTVTTRAMNAKAGSVTSGSTYRYGKSITVTATTNLGYTFLGWYQGNTLVCENESYKFTAENNVTLTAKWSANEDTKYTVEYYLENANKTAYTKVDTVVLEGTTDTTANANIAEYAHFTYTTTNSVTSGNISGNGTLVLKVYYTRDVYTITSTVENSKAGTVTAGGNYAYENSVSLVASSNPGYTFLGWYEGNIKVCDTLTFTFSAEKDVTYTAKWSADNATYTVNYYRERYTSSGYVLELMETVILDSKTGETVFAIAKDIERMMFSPTTSTMSGEVTWDNSLVLEVRYRADYDREGDYIYFGEYPQTLKSNDVTITSTVDERGYFLGSDGFYYAKVTGTRNNGTFSTGSNVIGGSTYYFKVEPIRWRILKQDGEATLIFCDSIIEVQRYDDRSNNYAESEIRAWLTNTFYESVFADIQKELILTIAVDNSKASSGSSNFCENTEDSVFLLSYLEVKSFSVESRKLDTTDYSRAKGVAMETNSSNYGKGLWWLRSPDSWGGRARVIQPTGSISDVYSGYEVYWSYGVAPAMWIKL